MTSTENNFEDWLCKKLTSLDIDNDVYGSYITEILRETEDEDRKTSLSEILESVIENSEELCNELVGMWKTFKTDEPVVQESSKNLSDIFAVHAAVSSQKVSHSADSRSRDEMSVVKQSIIAMYSDVQDGEDNEQDLEDKQQSSVDKALEVMKNTNADRISQAEKADRLKRKEEAAKKKEQDKVNRELQKIKKSERKEKEKKRTQKKERNR